MKSKLTAIALALSLLRAQDWEIARSGYRYQFPRDHFSHLQFQTEWWYYTGNLRAENGRRYGFELTFFRQAQKLSAEEIAREAAVWRPDQIYLAHLALSDIDGQSFFHTERLHRAGPGLAGGAFEDQRYWNGNWQVRWLSLSDAAQELTAVTDRFTLHLTLKPAKPPVVQGENGISRKGPQPGQASHYISFTRLAASGELRQANATQTLEGSAWMDHEFFTEPSASDVAGWDWFAIQLANNEEVMLYRLRDASGNVSRYSSGSYVDAQGKARFLSARDFSLTSGQIWQSRHSGARYPIAWRICVPSLGLVLDQKTGLKDQELTSKSAISPTYWEGAVSYTGTLRGRAMTGVGYLEMTGYRAPVRLSGMSSR